jgi:altronate dehydratase
MLKRAKDVTYGETLVTEGGLMPVRTVASDMYALTTMISNGADRFIFGAYEEVETLDD